MRREVKIPLKLWAAVLERAIEDLHYSPPDAREEPTVCEKPRIKQELRWKRQAQAWFKSSDKGFNGFEGVCLILGLEASEVRKKLEKKGLL
jgi:hypothetical protein